MPYAVRLMESLERRRLFSTARFAVIGDFGNNSQPEADVANLVNLLNPDFVATVGDNNYEVGGADTIDINIGQYYHEFIYNYQGIYGAGSPTRRFYPALGNHDWGNTFPNPSGADPYLNYFDLPGIERYYDFVAGPVHVFVLDSDLNEPAGITAQSTQAAWLRTGLAASVAPHKVVLLHHAPYSSSDNHGSYPVTQWPYSQWGATAVIAGHDHTYERLFVEGIPYFVNGLGGRSLYGFATPVPGSQFRYAADYGAMLIEADQTQMTFKFYARTGALIDTSTLVPGQRLPIVSVAATDPAAAEPASGGVYTVTRTGSTASPLTVHFTLSGTAAAGSDYQAVPLAVTIPIGEHSADIVISPIDDGATESTETAILTLSTDAAYNLGHDTAATVTITDNEIANVLLFSGGSTWRYLDNGSDQGTAWRNPTFDDSTWSSGGARFGYGDPGMVTTINAGPSNDRFTTHYFRTSFTVANPAAVTTATLNVLRDDGAIVYLNGAEIWRTNMPAGAVNADTFASLAVSGGDETTFFNTPLDPAMLQDGINHFAVELHQASLTTSDGVFDLYVTATIDNVAPTVTDKSFERDFWHDLRFTFSEQVAASVQATDLLMTDLDTGQPLPAGAFTLQTSGDPTVAVWTASTLLADGWYRARLPAGSVADVAGNALAGDAELIFRVLTGDADGNGLIDFDDYVAIDNGYNNGLLGFTNGDFNYDGVVDFDDYVLIDLAFNTQ